ncbi:endo-1,4-beta-xylanase [Streptomyces sp. NPDC059909]|uniref:endo-1,4-beta-xylanase n=1 Tax=Streptomyces sp. NPDC059909 TaxID=3346998 RepID=UPI003655126A
MTLPADDTEPARQADDYRRLLDACLNVRRCTSFTVWGFTDKYSWGPGWFEGPGRGQPARRECRGQARLHGGPQGARLGVMITSRDCLVTGVDGVGCRASAPHPAAGGGARVRDVGRVATGPPQWAPGQGTKHADNLGSSAAVRSDLPRGKTGVVMPVTYAASAVMFREADALGTPGARATGVPPVNFPRGGAVEPA